MLWQRADPAELMKRRKEARAGTRVAQLIKGKRARATNNTRQLLSGTRVSN